MGKPTLQVRGVGAQLHRSINQRQTTLISNDVQRLQKLLRNKQARLRTAVVLAVPDLLGVPNIKEKKKKKKK